MVSHTLSPAYRARVERFAVTFPTAHEFLKRIEAQGPPHHLWLSTAVNAHLYKGASFIAYLKVADRESRPPSLVCSPHFHLRIAAETRDGSGRLFPGVFNDVLAASGAHRGAWARRHADGVTELAASTPRELFTRLWEALCQL